MAETFQFIYAERVFVVAFNFPSIHNYIIFNSLSTDWTKSVRSHTQIEEKPKKIKIEFVYLFKAYAAKYAKFNVATNKCPTVWSTNDGNNSQVEQKKKRTK